MGGHFPEQVKAFCQRPTLKGIVVPIRGATRPQVALVVQGRKRSRTWFVDTIAIKDTIYASLRIESPAIPGYQGFPNDTEAGYFQQLLAEKKHKGKYEVFPEGARNEVLDLHVYCDAAMALWKLKPGDLEEMERDLAGPVKAEEPAAEVEDSGQEPEEPEAPGRSKAVRPVPGGLRVLGRLGRR